MKIRDWLRVFRAQTASASFILALVPYLLGGGEFLSWHSLFIFTFAILTHWFSFGHNSYIDTAMGYDVKDKHKSHHPLVNGSISMKSASNVINSGMFVLALILSLYIYLYAVNKTLAFLFFVLYIVSGHWYNDGFSKTSIFAFIPISLCFTSFGLTFYFISASEFNQFIIIYSIFIFLTIWYEISVEGDLKDLEVPQDLMMRRLGCKVHDGKLIRTKKAILYASFVKFTSIGLIIWLELNHLLVLILSIPFFILMIYFHISLFKTEYHRNNVLRYCALEEISSIYLGVLASSIYLGFIIPFIIMIIGILYFVMMNKINWGTIIRPQV